MKRSISMAPTLVVRQCKEVGARAGKGQRVYAPSGDGKAATRVKMGAWIETRSGEDTVILFSFFTFFTLPQKAQEQLKPAAILAIDGQPIFFPDVDNLARAGCNQLSYIETLSGRNTIELRVSIFEVYVHLKKISQMKH
jgi:hypothetical protein